MYSEVSYAVKTTHGITEKFSSNVGVKQGCVLSPSLFNLFLYDLPNIFDNTCNPVQLSDIQLIA